MNREGSVTQPDPNAPESNPSPRSIVLLWGLLVVLIVALIVAIQVSRGDGSSGNESSSDTQAPVLQVEQLLDEAIQLIDQSRYVEGVALLEAALRLDATNPLVHYNIGVAYQFNGDLGKAEAAYSEALSLDNRLERAYYNRGLARRDSGNLTGARDDLRIAAALDPDNAAAHYNLGQVLLALGEADAGAESIQKAKSLNPSIGG